jgi:hypothetical protein
MVCPLAQQHLASPSARTSLCPASLLAWRKLGSALSSFKMVLSSLSLLLPLHVPPIRVSRAVLPFFAPPVPTPALPPSGDNLKFKPRILVGLEATCTSGRCTLTTVGHYSPGYLETVRAPGTCIAQIRSLARWTGAERCTINVNFGLG